MHMDKWTKNGQMNRWNYINFDSNLPMMVMYLRIKFEFDWTKHFELECGNGNVERQTDKNGQTK